MKNISACLLLMLIPASCFALTVAGRPAGETITLPAQNDNLTATNSPTELLRQKLKNYGFVLQDILSTESDIKGMARPSVCPPLDSKPAKVTLNVTNIRFVVRSAYDVAEILGQWGCSANVVSFAHFADDIQCVSMSDGGTDYVIPRENTADKDLCGAIF